MVAWYYRKRGSASYIVREVREVRERDTERERERERERRKWRHLSSAEMGDEFCTFPCQNVHLSIDEEFCTFLCQKCAPLSRTPLLNGAEFTLPLHVNTLHETVRILRRFCQMAWQGIEAPVDDRISGCTVLLLIEKMNEINTKNYWK